MQHEQLEILKYISGVNFNFVPLNQNNFNIKYYEHKCTNDEEYQEIAGRLNEHAGIVYRCLEYPDKSASVIVLESESDAKRFDSIVFNGISNKDDLKPIGKINGNNVLLEPILTSHKKYATIVETGGRAIAVVNINGRRLPFYVSSGASGKEQEFGIPSGKWYPLQGVSEVGWLNKMPNMLQNPYPELDQICTMLEQKFPANKLKQEALKGLLPSANRTELLKTANSDFPEGMPLSEYPSYTYVKNHCVYLPQIINTWRSKPSDFLNVRDGSLATRGQKILNKVQKMHLFCGSMLDGDYIWFYPIEDSEYVASNGTDTSKGIKQTLYNFGINLRIIATRQDRNGFGVPIKILDDFFKQQEQQVFEQASQNLQQDTPTKQVKNNSSLPFFTKIAKLFKN